MWGAGRGEGAARSPELRLGSAGAPGRQRGGLWKAAPRAPRPWPRPQPTSDCFFKLKNKQAHTCMNRNKQQTHTSVSSMYSPMLRSLSYWASTCGGGQGGPGRSSREGGGCRGLRGQRGERAAAPAVLLAPAAPSGFVNKELGPGCGPGPGPGPSYHQSIPPTCAKYDSSRFSTSSAASSVSSSSSAPGGGRGMEWQFVGWQDGHLSG